ncbi:MAG: MBL fold metallo-hydrolase [Anaerolineaceae bacterium]|nr:MBL fold metallo-hydrolase [Anaerolineaceae bacterium]
MKKKSPAIEINSFMLGPIENNTYLVTDAASREAVIIDPSFDISAHLKLIPRQASQVKYILITHAHFDHIAGVHDLVKMLPEKPVVGLHPSDLPLWNDCKKPFTDQYQMGILPAPTHLLSDDETISIGSINFNIHHTPGHCPGHVIFSIPEAKVVFCGDVIFAGAIGRTDLPGGDYAQLIESIRNKILVLPDETRLLPGHGPETTVGFERLNNPFLK